MLPLFEEAEEDDDLAFDMNIWSDGNLLSADLCVTFNLVIASITSAVSWRPQYLAHCWADLFLTYKAGDAPILEQMSNF